MKNRVIKFKNIISKIVNFKYIKLCIFLFSLLISLFITVFADNLFFFSKENKEKIEINNYYITPKDDYFEVYIPTNSEYSDEIKISYNIKNNANIDYDLYVKESGKYKLINHEKLFPTSTSGIYKVKTKTEIIKLKVFSKTENITFNSIEVQNFYKFNFVKFIIILCATYLGLSLVLTLLNTNKIQFHKEYFKYALAISIIYCIITPFYYTYDEKEHMVRSYNITNLNFIQEKDELSKWPNDMDDFLEKPYSVSISSTYSQYKENVKKLNEIGKTEGKYVIHNSTASPYLFPAYVVSGAGMLVGKILHLPFIFQFYLGRIFNALMYVIITTIAIKLAGKYSKIIFLISSIPLVFLQGASFSADTLTNSMAILSVALTMYYKYSKEKISKLNILLLLMVYLLTFISKIAYFPISLLILLIPNSKFENKKTAILTKVMVIIISVVVFLIGTIYAEKIGIVQWVSDGVDSKEQFKYILMHPFNYVLVMFKTFNLNLTSMLKTSTVVLAYCGDLGDIAFWIIIVFMFLVIANSYDCKNLNVMDKIVLLLVILLCIGSSMTSLYISFTPIGNDTILGYQGRYLIPVLTPTLCLLVNNKLKYSIKDDSFKKVMLVYSFVLNFAAIIMITTKYYS